MPNSQEKSIISENKLFYFIYLTFPTRVDIFTRNSTQSNYILSITEIQVHIAYKLLAFRCFINQSSQIREVYEMICLRILDISAVQGLYPR
jgi:hypothetical protein